MFIYGLFCDEIVKEGNESIDDNIETAQVIRRQIKQILLQNLFRLRPILAPNNIREPRSGRLPQLLLILYVNRYQS